MSVVFIKEQFGADDMFFKFLNFLKLLRVNKLVVDSEPIKLIGHNNMNW